MCSWRPHVAWCAHGYHASSCACCRSWLCSCAVAAAGHDNAPAGRAHRTLPTAGRSAEPDACRAHCHQGEHSSAIVALFLVFIIFLFRFFNKLQKWCSLLLALSEEFPFFLVATKKSPSFQPATRQDARKKGKKQQTNKSETVKNAIPNQLF